jgi:hypothetical protein
VLSLRVLGGRATADAEEALREQQIDHHRDVHDQRDDLQRRALVDDLVDLERDEQRGRDQRQILRPPLLPPEPERLDSLERGVPEHAEAHEVQRARLEREELVQFPEQPDVVLLHGPATQVRGHAVEGVP